MRDLICIYLWLGAFINFILIILINNAYSKQIEEYGMIITLLNLILDILVWPHLIYLLISGFIKRGDER